MALDVKRVEGDGWVSLHPWRSQRRRAKMRWLFAKRAAELGAGEILLTSMDRDGAKNGYDIDLLRAIRDVVRVPIIASGGAGNVQHMADAVIQGRRGCRARRLHLPLRGSNVWPTPSAPSPRRARRCACWRTRDGA